MAQNINLNSFPGGLAEEKVREFALHLVKQKNFEGLDEATFGMLVEDVYDRLEERINAVILVNIPGGKVGELEKLLGSGNKKEVSQFCEKNIPNLQDIITQALLEFEKTYLGLN